MRLTDEQDALLRGQSGKALSRAMQTLVEYGDAFGARRLVEIKSAHLAGTFGAYVFKAYYGIIGSFVKEGLKVKVPTSTNPKPGRTLNLTNRIAFSKQGLLESHFAALGVIPNFSCACYEGINTPQFGDVLAWAESSAVQYANSVIGARSNRNSVVIDIFSAMTGYTPEFGYLLTENRRGQVLVKIAAKDPDPSALGFVIGKRVVDRVPVIENFAIDRVGLKNLGASMSATGATALFHIEGVTPEAPTLGDVFDAEPDEVITITQRELDEVRARAMNKIDMVVFGVPHLDVDSAADLAAHFAGKRTKKKTWFCMSSQDHEKFARLPVYAQAIDAGVEIHELCPLAALSAQFRRKTVLSPSAKLHHYLEGCEFGTVGDCLRVCGVC